MLHQDVCKLFQTAKNKTLGKPIGNNLRLIKLDGDSYGIKLHNTVIVRIMPDNRYRLNSGGWRTVTTKKRINEYLPENVYLFESKHEWYLRLNGIVISFEDGIVLKLKE